ncbi:MAG: J domain-containing protein [Desulfobulbaceae bacterium]|nr:J domain-containing protein [Desulfobulbaceae bacterium]
MTAVFVEHELFASCRVLFGAELDITRNFLEYLQRSGIKSAYRKKALETHPDILASQRDSAQGASVDLFRRVQQSYENLTAYLDARDNGFRFPSLSRPHVHSAPRKPQPAPRPEQRWPNSGASEAKPKVKPKPKPKTKTTDQPGGFTRFKDRPSSAWTVSGDKPLGAIPSRRLLFGHYLYYAGLTNWQTIVKALVWQRTGRPRLGEIGRRFGWLTDQDILTVLKKRKLSDSFGASAVDLGLLTERQLSLMLYQQNKLQKRFGEYFIHHKLMTPTQLDELARHCFRHNTSFDRQRPYAARM